MRIPRAAAAIALAAGIALGTTGCSYLTPLGTVVEYNPSDGINVSVGDVDVRNAVAVINQDGHAISLIITLVNTGGAKTVKLQYESGGERTDFTVAMPKGTVRQFGNTVDQEQIIILSPGVKAGQLLPVYVQYGAEPGKQLLVPVLSGTTAGYEDLVPPEILRG